MYQDLLVLGLFLCAAALYLKNGAKLLRRIRVLERDLQTLTNAMSNMVEIQIRSHRRHIARFEDLEERIMDLSIPSHDARLPLERRHHVLALARQGIGLDDIAKRLKAPVGEAELILNLRKYMHGGHPGVVRNNEQVRQNA